MTRLSLAIFCLAALLQPASGQTPVTCASVIDNAVTRVSAERSNSALTPSTRENRVFVILTDKTPIRICANERARVGATAAAVAKQQTQASLQIATKRSDVQTGAGSGSAGSTNAVASASKTDFLGLALENGAVTQSTSGTAATLSINPWKFANSLATDEKVRLNPNDFGSRLLRRLALSITLNTGTGSTSSQSTSVTPAGTQSSSSPTAGSATTSASTPAMLLTQLKNVSDFTAHFDIRNERDPMSASAERKIQGFIRPSLDLFTQSDLIDSLLQPAEQGEIRKLADTSVVVADLKSELTSYFNNLSDTLLDSEQGRNALGRLTTASADLAGQNKRLYDKFAHSWVLATEYSLDRQPMVQATAASSTATSTPALMNPPDLHTGRLIFSNQLINNSEFTLTASSSFFGQKTASMPDSWRDLQFGAKIDVPLTGLANVVDAGTLTLSGLFVDLHQMPLGINLQVNGVSVTQPGWIKLFQAKYTIPLSGSSGVQMPISITYSNRTDLIKDTTIQGNIGITFDMSKLVAAKVTANTTQ